MRTVLFSIVMLLVFEGLVIAQPNENPEKNIVSFTAGPSFPLGEFASKNTSNVQSGLAKTGYTIELKYAHQFDELFAVTSSAAYGRFAIDQSKIDAGTTSIKPWEYYSLLIGPMITGNIGKKIVLDIGALTGYAYINAPKVNVNNEVVSKKNNTNAIPLKFAVDFRFTFTQKAYLFSGINYLYMRPNFITTVQSEDISFKQQMNTIGINAGIGFIF
jgi:hypothetical protein